MKKKKMSMKLVISLIFLLPFGIVGAKDESFWKKAIDALPATLSVFGMNPAGVVVKLLKEGIDIQEENFEEKVLNAFKSLESSTEKSKKLIIEDLVNLISNIELKNQLNNQFDDMNKILSYEIESLHSQWLEILDTSNKFENETLIKFAYENINGKFVTKIHQFLRGPKHQSEAILSNLGLLDILGKLMSSDNSDKFCLETYKTSPQQTLLNYFVRITTLQLDAYLMTIYSYDILRKFNSHDQNYMSEVESFIRNSMVQLENSIEKMLENAEKIDRDFWQCNPKTHVKGKTYLEASHTFQAVVLNEDEYCDRFHDLIPPADFLRLNKIGICEADFTSSRRYDFIEIIPINVLFGAKEINVYGEKKFCDNKLHRVESDDRWQPWGPKHRISVCFDKNSMADRYFDLRPITSDLGDNKVVTGIRFWEKNKNFRLQIQQGELMKNGQVNQSTVAWKDPADELNREIGLARGDIHALTMKERRIEFADFKTRPDQVVTGIRFFQINGVLKLSVQANRIDLRSGNISPFSNWMNKTRIMKEELQLNEPDLPILSKSSSPVSKPSQFVKFTFSNFKKDASQTTIPLIDCQDVTSKPFAVPLQGIGLFLKGENGYGGFLTLKIKTFDYMKYFKKKQWSM